MFCNNTPTGQNMTKRWQIWSYKMQCKSISNVHFNNAQFKMNFLPDLATGLESNGMIQPTTNYNPNTKHTVKVTSIHF